MTLGMALLKGTILWAYVQAPIEFHTIGVGLGLRVYGGFRVEAILLL
jgi:hypothetical protein